MNPTVTIKTGSTARAIGLQRGEQETLMSNTLDAAKAPLIIQNKLQPSFNSSHHVGEHKAVSIRSMYNPSPHMRQSNLPLSPQLTYALNDDIKKELGKKSQVGVNTVNPLIRIDNYNKE